MKEEKKQKIYRIGENEYRRLKRRETQLLRAKNHIRIAWQTLKQVGDEVPNR